MAKKVSEFLRDELQRRWNGDSLRSITKAANVDYGTVHRWLYSDNRQLRSNTLDALCATLGIEVIKRSEANR